MTVVNGKMVIKWLPDLIERFESVSIASALFTTLTIYLCQIRVHQTLTPTSYSSEEGVVAGYSGQFTPGGYLSTVKHTVLAGIEPSTFRSFVRRATMLPGLNIVKLLEMNHTFAAPKNTNPSVQS